MKFIATILIAYFVLLGGVYAQSQMTLSAPPPSCNGSIIKIRLTSFSGITWPVDNLQKREFINNVWGSWTNVSANLGYDGTSWYWNVTLTAKTEYRAKELVSGGTLYSNVVSVNNQYQPRLLLYGQDSGGPTNYFVASQGSSIDFSINKAGATNVTVTWYKNNVQVTNSPFSGIPDTHQYSYYGSSFETWKAYVYNNQTPGGCGQYTNEITIQPNTHIRIGTTASGSLSSGETAVINILSYYGVNWNEMKLEKRDFINGAWTSWVDTNSPVIYTGYSVSFNYSIARKSKYRVYVPVSGGRIESGIIEFDVLNSITTFTPISPLNSESSVRTQIVDNVNKSTNYFDGLGRPMQSVVWQGSPNKKDIVQPIVYDGFGRDYRKYLPVVPNTTDGWYKPGIIDVNGNYSGAASGFYNNGLSDKIVDDAKPYAETMFEINPLNRASKQGGVGLTWQPDATNSYSSTDKTVKYKYEFNVGNEVLLWSYTAPTPAYPLGLVNAGSAASPVYYTANQLYKNKTKDEHQNEVIEFIDKEGRTILKKVQSDAGQFASTYYIYDDFGSLVCVIPPEAVARLATEYYQPGAIDATKDSFLSRWAFRYRYDGGKRMILKQVPGADSIRMVYDIRDRLVLTQDGNQRLNNKWTYTKYDALNRPIMTGIYTHNISETQKEMSARISTSIFYESYNGNGATHGYTSTTAYFPSSNLELLTATYYDTYLFKSLTSGLNYFNNDYTGQSTSQPTENLYVRDQVTGTKINILGTSNYLFGVYYYDNRYRVIQSITQNHKSGTDRITNKYDFPGKVMETKRTYVVNGVERSVKETFTYDHSGRLLTTKHSANDPSVNPSEVMIVKNEYNEIGELVDKKLHSTDNGSTFKQSVDFRYNIRGWLTSMNNSKLSSSDVTNDDNTDLFGMELGYNNDIGLGASAQYNGNISSIKWSNNTIESEVLQRGYVFTYDVMNRLKLASQKEAIIFDIWTPGNYDENITEYDLNGNIKKLQRKDGAGSLIDDLTYTYETLGSNRLVAVSDGQNPTKGFINGNTGLDDYDYDKNGNLKFDKNKGITSITYNHLNLPVQVNKGATDYIVYTYDATGKKLTQQVFGSSPKTTDYIGELIFENTLKIILHSEGRVLPDGPNWEYQYNLKDHLGNVRTTFSVKEITETNTATLETANENAEYGEFLRFNEARKIQSFLFDYTNGVFPSTTTGYAQRLSGSTNERYGLAKSVSVMPGDVISAEVFAKYVDQSSINPQTSEGQALLALLAAISSGSSGVVVDGVSYTSSTSSFLFPVEAALVTAESSEAGPKAYLNWLVFKRDGTFLLAQSGYDRLSTVPKELGQDVAHERLYSPEIPISEPGFVYFYLSNEEGTPVEVYFDDFKVTHTIKTPVVQTDDYYPFGLTLNSFQRENSVANNYLYNGKEKQDELNLDWLDYQARQYEPSLGRFLSVDPLSDLTIGINPYQYGFNNPISFTDPTGMFAEEFGPQSFTSTFVDPNGKVIRHIDDDDPRVYLVSDQSSWDGQSKEGLDIVGFEDPSKTYKNGDQYTHYNPREDPNFKGQYLIPEEAYDYTENEIEGKGSEDWAYLRYGNDGNYFTRAWNILYRDITADENRETVIYAGDKILTRGIYGKAKKLLGAKSRSSGKERATDIPSWAKGQKPSSGQSGKDWAKDTMNKQYGQGWDKDPNRMKEYSKLKKYGDRHDK